MTKFRRAWPKLSPEAQEFWLSRFLSDEAPPYQETFKLIAARLKINFTRPAQGTAIKEFLLAEQKRQEVADRMEANETRIHAEHPDWTADQVRDEVIKAAYYETLASGDFKLGLSTIKAESLVKTTALDQRKFEFDAARACMDKLPELQAIRKDSSLTTAQKLDQIRFKLFGEIAEESSATTGNGGAKT